MGTSRGASERLRNVRQRTSLSWHKDRPEPTDVSKPLIQAGKTLEALNTTDCMASPGEFFVSKSFMNRNRSSSRAGRHRALATWQGERATLISSPISSKNI